MCVCVRERERGDRVKVGGVVLCVCVCVCVLTRSPQLYPKPHPLSKLRMSDIPHNTKLRPRHKHVHPRLQGDVGHGGEGEGGGGEGGSV